jgi:hypothetical protein
VQTGVQKMHFTRSGTIVPRSRAIVERIVLTFLGVVPVVAMVENATFLYFDYD